ncbi:hypothetical protein FH972_022916 [Carpinus fangiana]|uniref:non-specific serine/threonine protein kinase n=1 Tax=Carpinus fangiana TaxID=176857 RepID=A0A5N6KU07_9ROSI|nr:hypothetical protein FH972_022916 [Carpinus fangiana]
MADAKVRRANRDAVVVHVDNAQTKRRKLSHEDMEESRDPLEDSGCTRDADSEESDDNGEVEDSVAEDMQRLERSFRGFSKKYRLINRIGEGTFSTVYKAEDLHYESYSNKWDLDEKENLYSPSGRKTHQSGQRRPHFVAIKKIYVTSSPQRIMNELDLLHDLRHSDAICPLITAFRDKDQVVAILPYFRHLDFRAYFRDMNVADMRIYFRSLFTALAAVHDSNILHRDIKPTNFLYDTHRKRGVLVDFGLAERHGTDHQPCLCTLRKEDRKQRIQQSYNHTHDHPLGYPKGDQRPSLRANRAGTRGFRAPEVLFKCTAQTTKIDVWSAGIILLTILARRFPFFNSSDDIDAVIELATVFGKAKMKKCAMLHGQMFECNIPTIGEEGYTLEKIIIWSTRSVTRDKYGNKIRLGAAEAEAVEFLEACLAMNPDQRISAADALQHPFLKERDGGSEDEMDVLSMSSPAQ